MLLASSVQSPEMLLCLLQGTGQPQTKKYLVPNVNTAEVEKACPEHEARVREKPGRGSCRFPAPSPPTHPAQENLVVSHN